MAAFTYEFLEALPARNVYDEVAEEFSGSNDRVWKVNFTDTTSHKADSAGLRRAVRDLNVRVVTIKGEMYLTKEKP